VREVELKSVVPDADAARRAAERAGARLEFEGRLEDRRYDDAARSMLGRDHVLRVRVYRDAAGARASLDWKGPTGMERGYKVREALVAIVERLGYVVTREIDRDIAQYALLGATVRFERYPRMDVLVEVEGPEDAIERAIAVLGLEREGFTGERLQRFVERFEARTGVRAALCDRELSGDYSLAAGNA
jgi:adenylate cyclase class IV